MLNLNNSSDIMTAIALAYEATSLEVDNAMLESIVDARYSWPRGESPRDIVDTGALGESQSVVLNGDVINMSWSVDYSIAVHEGVDNKPARRWTREAIAGDETAPLEWQNPRAILNVPAYFIDKFKSVYE
jgi:hypothetical protein